MGTQYDSYVAEIEYTGEDSVRVQYPTGEWRDVTLLPNQILVRKDQRDEMEDGIVLPDRAWLDIPVQGGRQGSISRVTNPREDTNSVRILAIGKDVGKKFLDMGIHRGQNVWVRSGCHYGIVRSDWSYFDYFIDYRRDLIDFKIE